MAKISNFKDTEGTEKEQEFINCNKTMRAISPASYLLTRF